MTIHNSAQVEDGNGYIEIDANPITKSGIFDYYGSEINAPEPNKLYKVLRSDDMLSNPEVVNTFRGSPFVLGHTMLGKGQTPAEKKGIDGTIGDKVFYKDGTLYGNLHLWTNKIKDFLAARKQKDEKVELSAGYYSTYDFTPGTYKGETYDAVQTIKFANHLAALDGAGRCGETVAVLDHDSTTLTNLTITFDNKEIDMGITQDELTAALAPLLATIDEMAKKIATLDDEDAEKDEDDEKKKVETKDSEKDDDDEVETKEEEKDDEKETMDAAAFTASVRAELIKSGELAKIATPLVGNFDHSAMSSSDIAKYAAGKLKLTGDPETALRAYAKGISAVKPTTTMDAKAPRGENQLRAGAFV